MPGQRSVWPGHTAKKKSAVGHSLSKEVFALKVVSNPCVSEVENEVLISAIGQPFLVQLLSYFQTTLNKCITI